MSFQVKRVIAYYAPDDQIVPHTTIILRTNHNWTLTPANRLSEKSVEVQTGVSIYLIQAVVKQLSGIGSEIFFEAKEYDRKLELTITLDKMRKIKREFMKHCIAENRLDNFHGAALRTYTVTETKAHEIFQHFLNIGQNQYTRNGLMLYNFKDLKKLQEEEKQLDFACYFAIIISVIGALIGAVMFTPSIQKFSDSNL